MCEIINSQSTKCIFDLIGYVGIIVILSFAFFLIFQLIKDDINNPDKWIFFKKIVAEKMRDKIIGLALDKMLKRDYKIEEYIGYEFDIGFYSLKAIVVTEM